jgi:hypothetical protein
LGFFKEKARKIEVFAPFMRSFSPISVFVISGIWWLISVVIYANHEGPNTSVTGAFKKIV